MNKQHTPSLSIHEQAAEMTNDDGRKFLLDCSIIITAIHVGEANWFYGEYTGKNNNRIYAVALPYKDREGCKAAHFGDAEYLHKHLEKRRELRVERAAPELLAACRVALGWIENLDWQWDVERPASIEGILADAIAKATLPQP